MLKRMRYVTLGAVVTAICVGCGSGGSSGGGSTQSSGSLGPGITTPSPLPPFTPSSQIGAKPKLPAVIGYAQDSPRGFEQDLALGMQAGAKDTGLQFKDAESNGDPQKQVQNMQQFLVEGVGAMVTAPDVGAAALQPVMRQALSQGIDMSALIFGPATIQVNDSQYRQGSALANAAATYIKTKLGGKASVVILNEDNIQAVRPFFQALRNILTAIPGVKIVADVAPAQPDSAHAFQTMTTILQKVPHVDAVLGIDDEVLGALAALQAAHKANPAQFLGGVSGQAPALAAIQKGDGPYKASIPLAPAIFGYAWARYAADWLAGKNVPQAMEIVPNVLTNAAEVAQYQNDEAHPTAVFNDPTRLSRYLRMYGSISYATRGKYLAYTWTPPQ